MTDAHAHRGAVVLVTIAAEAIVEARLLRDLRAAGAHGWTITTARGEGPRNRRVGDLEGGNVRIETLVSHATADAIMAKLSADWFPHYAVVAWISDVEVVREDRFL
jgi:nitrogen regulatory protein P-II 2